MEMKIIDERELFNRNFKIYGTVEEPLFLAKDIAEMIGHSDPSTMMRMVDEEEKQVVTMFVSGQNRKVLMVTEDGLYEILMKSDKPIAKEFKKQVKAILKEIRKNGGYIATNESELDEGIEVRQTEGQSEPITNESVRGYDYEDDTSMQEQHNSQGATVVNSSNSDVRVTNINVTKSDNVIDYIA